MIYVWYVYINKCTASVPIRFMFVVIKYECWSHLRVGAIGIIPLSHHYLSIHPSIVPFVWIFKLSHTYYTNAFSNRVIFIQNYYIIMITRRCVFVFKSLYIILLYRYSFSYTLHSVRCPHIRPSPLWWLWREFEFQRRVKLLITARLL